MIPSAFYSFHLISFTRISRGPSQHKKWILKQQVRVPLNPKHSRKSPANVRTPSVTSPEPLPKRPENPSRATAVFVGRVHRGPRRDQLLDHGGMAFAEPPNAAPSRPRAPRMRRGRRGSCGCRRETKRIVMGCFSRLLGKILNIGRRLKICQADTLGVRHWGENESNHRRNKFLIYHKIRQADTFLYLLV